MGYYSSWYGGFAPYVPVAERRRKAEKEVARLRKKGKTTSPVVIEGRAIATTFWGKAWCDNLESYSDYTNRLPRGRSYVRNGSVVDLQIEAGALSALVMGSELYRVGVEVKPLVPAKWQELIHQCAGQIDSLIDLLRGKLSRGTMEVITRKEKGLFPNPAQVQFSCSCPDMAHMCKHVAAVLYGVGVRLDQEPELLFRLRKVDHLELITSAGTGRPLGTGASSAQGRRLASEDLSALFGIELSNQVSSSERESAPDLTSPPPAREPARQKKAAGPARSTRRAPLRITRQELLAQGLTPSMLQTWLRRGLLVPSGERGTYKTTAAARKRLAGQSSQ